MARGFFLRPALNSAETGGMAPFWLAIGDVCGHGVTPGLIMMMAQTIHATLTTTFATKPAKLDENR